MNRETYRKKILEISIHLVKVQIKITISRDIL